MIFFSCCIQKQQKKKQKKEGENVKLQTTNEILLKSNLKGSETEKSSFSNSQVEQITFGLPNLGNTCFFNSVVQMMIHCSNLTRQWPKNPNQQILNQLNLIKQAHNNQNLIKKLNKQLFKMLPFQNKEVSHQTGNDPVRVFSSIIENSKVERNTIHIKYPPNRLKDDYQYWVEDSSQLEFLFSSVGISGVWCDKCKKFELQNEQRNFLIQISKFQGSSSIQDILTQVTKSFDSNQGKGNKAIQSCSQCRQQRKFINGFLKLPQFLVINLDEKIDIKKMKIEDQVKLFDIAREQDVEYNLIGFISHPTFHYTYFRRENKNSLKWTHFNDNYVQTETFKPNEQMAKILLYSSQRCSRDPNIHYSMKNQLIKTSENNQFNQYEAYLPNSQMYGDIFHQVPPNKIPHEFDYDLLSSNSFEEQPSNEKVLRKNNIQNYDFNFILNNTLQSKGFNQLDFPSEGKAQEILSGKCTFNNPLIYEFSTKNNKLFSIGGNQQQQQLSTNDEFIKTDSQLSKSEEIEERSKIKNDTKKKDKNDTKKKDKMK